VFMKEYIKTKWKAVLLAGICFGIMATVLWLYGYPPEPIIYGAVLCLIPVVIFFIYGYFSFCNRRQILMQIRQTLPVDLNKLPKPENSVETQIGEIIRGLDQMRMESEERRQRSYTEMSDYYTIWVHQIKTPVASLRLLLSEESEKNKAALGEVFRVEEYVDMVLGYLRTEDISADMKFSDCSLDTIVKEQIHRYAPVFIEKKLTLSFENTGKHVLTDPKWLGFVIGQCLSNALKYTKTGGVRIFLSGPDSGTLVIEDTGKGIRREDLPRIFEKGFTGYNGREENGSTGIGLYLSGKIMKKLNHGIYLESAVGQGTKVFLDLKRKEAEMF